MNYFHWKSPPCPICFYHFSSFFKCTPSPPVFPHPLPSRLKCNVGRIMENYPVYKKLLKSGGAPLPNDTESNYRMFQHPFHRKGSISGATRHAYETHLVHITISCRGAVEPRLSLPRLFKSSVCDGRVLVSTEDKGAEKRACMQTRLCFSFPCHGARSDSLLLR